MLQKQLDGGQPGRQEMVAKYEQQLQKVREEVLSYHLVVFTPY